MKARRERASCSPRPDGAVLHRTAPIFDRTTGRYLGATCACGEVVTTDRGGQSMPHQAVGPFARVVTTRAHRLRVRNARIARKLARKAARG